MKLEYDKEEIKAIHSTLLQMTKMICDVATLGIKTSHEYQMEELRQRKQPDSGNIGQYSIKSDECDNVFPRSTDIDSKDQKDKLYMEMFNTFEEKDLTNHQINGKFELSKLLEFWLQNFKNDELPQPDRNEYIEKLAQDGKRAGSIVSYCMAIGGLTKAIWNAIDSNDALTLHYSTWSTSDKAKEIRYIAGNITQVCSIHLHPLADQFDYPNPIHFLYEE